MALSAAAPQSTLPLPLLLNDTIAGAASHRKRSACASGGVSGDDYNLPLHVGALFIILFVSFTGCAFPILASKVPGLRIPARFFFVVRHFGTGVLIATAFVHLLPTAFVSLNNPCLPKFWTTDYQAMPGAIALAAVFLVTLIEMIFHPARRMAPADLAAGAGAAHGGCMANVMFVSEEPGAQQPIRDMGPINGRQSSVGQELSQLSRNLSATIEASRDQTKNAAASKNEAAASSDEDSFRPPTLSAHQQERRDRLQCILLELGILFHSVFIGMALSVSVGNEFIVLLIAITFHRTPTLICRDVFSLTQYQKRLRDWLSVRASQRSNGKRQRFSPGSWRSPMAARMHHPTLTDVQHSR